MSGRSFFRCVTNARRHVLAERVVGAHRSDALDVRPLRHDLRAGAALDRGVAGGAENIGVQIFLRDELVGLHDRHHEDDLVLLRDRRDSRAFGRGERAEQEIDVVAQDQIARDAHRLVGVALGVTRDELDLAAEDAAFGVDLLDEHLRALHRRLADQRARPRQDHRIADADGFLRLRLGRHEEGGCRAKQCDATS